MSKGNVLTLLLTVLAGYAALCALLYLLQERLIFLPRSLSEHTRSALRGIPEVVEIEVRAGDGTRLHGWLRRGTGGAGRRGLVIYFGGNAEEVSGQVLDADTVAPWSLAAFNYRGYGLSEGRPSEAALVADALVVYDRLAEREDIDPDRIVVFGRSLGSGGRGAACRGKAGAGRRARLPLRQPAERRPAALPVRTGAAAPPASIRFPGSRAVA